jgi:hypothetical protein
MLSKREVEVVAAALLALPRRQAVYPLVAQAEHLKMMAIKMVNRVCTSRLLGLLPAVVAVVEEVEEVVRLRGTVDSGRPVS